VIARAGGGDAAKRRNATSTHSPPALVAMGAKDRLRIHVQGALNHGATPEEIQDVILTMMIYAGRGRATEAIEVAREVLLANSQG